MVSNTTTSSTNDSTIAIDIIFASNDDNPEQVLGEISNEQLVEKDSRGRTSVHAACSQGKPNILVYILNRLKANPEYDNAKSAPDHKGITPVHYACGMKWEESGMTAVPIHINSD